MYQSDDLIRGVGRSLHINERRDNEYHQNGVHSPGSQPWRGPQSPPYGTSSGGSYPGSYQGSYPSGGRASQTGAGDEDEDYSKSVSDIKQMFNKPTVQQTYSGIRLNARPGSTSYVSKRPTFSRPHNAMELSEPGWIPRNKPSPHSQDRYAPSAMKSPPINRRGNDLQNYRPPPPVVYREAPEKPAWLGSLRPSGGPKVWEIQEQRALVGESAVAAAGPPVKDHSSAPIHSQTYPGAHARGRSQDGGNYGGNEPPVVVHNPKVQSFRYGAGGDQTYEQHQAGPGGQDSDSARVAHLQYNSPIGLYSKQNALEVLQGQTKGKPGEGTLQITGTGGAAFNSGHQSDVYRMIKEEEEQRRHGGGARPVSSGPPPMRRPQRRPSPPRQEEAHSARFHQLVNENNDQMEEYMRMPHHNTGYPSGSYGGGAGGGRSIPIGHDQGISDF